MSKGDMTWMGRPIKDLSREELLEVIDQLATELESLRSPYAIRARALGQVEMLKRGEANVDV